MKRTFAIGDVHGCFDKLEALMGKIPINLYRDQLVFIGDYIDRGPYSFEVVDYLVELKKRYPGIVFLKGNHEDMLEKYLNGTDRFSYLMNGGQRTLDGYLHRTRQVSQSAIPQDHLDFYNSLVMYYETEDYIFVHAGLRNGIPLEKQSAEDLLWIREKFIYSNYDFGKQVVFGHTPLTEPLVEPNKIGIDTGAVYGHFLTCVQLPEVKFFSL
jgi:serine/threonine protein phosphatase 1